ncbi:MAG: BON domain-containing protein [Acidobacteriaceae bacterium]
MLIQRVNHRRTQPKFFRKAAVALLAVSAWFAFASLAVAQQRTDSQIQSDVAAAFQQDSTLQGQHITAAIDKGVATLTGTVQTTAQSQQAETDAANVAGVSGILNQLKIEKPNTTAPDAGLAAQSSANQLNPQEQQDQNQSADQTPNQPQAQGQNENSVPPPPPDENQPEQPQQPQQAQQPQQPYGAPPPNQPGYAPPPPQVPYYQTPVAPITIPTGTLVRVRLDQPLDTAHLQSGTIFQATNAVDVYERGILAIPRGAMLTGQVIEAKEGGRLGGAATLELRLMNVNLAGKVFPLVTDVWSSRGPNKAGYTASNTAGGAVLGAIIGGLIGRGAGAAIGAGVGAAGGLAASSASNGPRVYLPVEAQVDFHLANPATVQPVSWQEAQRLASSAPRPPVLVQRPRRPVYAVPRPYYGYPYPY